MDASVLTHPILETERLTLRPLRKSDAGLISLYTSDLRVARMTSSIPHPNPPGAVEQFIARVQAADSAETTWAIDGSRGFGCELMGVVGLEKDGEIGYWLGPFFWNLGIVTEAVTAVCAHSRASDYPRMRAHVFQENPASRRVLEKVGFVLDREGTGFSVAQNQTVKTWEMIDGTG